MVLQIRFAIWLTLQIEVEALHIYKPSHHFASTILAFHVGLRPPLLGILNANRKIRKRRDTDVAFTREYSRVSIFHRERECTN